MARSVIKQYVAIRLAAEVVEISDMAPGFIGRLAPFEEVQILAVYGAFLDKSLEIDDAAPEILAKQHHGNRLHLAGLDKR